MKACREEGIGKIVDTFGGERGKPTHRIQAVTDPSRQYTFAGGPEGVDGSVKFLYRTDSIG